jgi:hypothetical protein
MAFDGHLMRPELRARMRGLLLLRLPFQSGNGHPVVLLYSHAASMCIGAFEDIVILPSQAYGPARGEVSSTQQPQTFALHSAIRAPETLALAGSTVFLDLGLMPVGTVGSAVERVMMDAMTRADHH